MANVLPLEGIRVLSQAIVWAGPAASQPLADLGAEVIDVETIQHLNPTRTTYRHPPEIVVEGPAGAMYLDRDVSEGFWNRCANYNYGKRGHKSITLDLTREEGRALFYDLVRVSDVFIENNAASVVEKLGIDWPRLSTINSRLIMGRFPGFGITGPYRNFKGYAPTMGAAGGHTHLRGYADSDPTWTPGAAHGDPNAGMHMAFAIQAALYARERTGEGQLIDLSHIEAVIHHVSYAFMDYAMNGRVQRTLGNRHPSKAPNGIFACAPDPEAARPERWIAIAVPSDEAFAALAREMGRPELAEDERFADVVSRHRNQHELEPLIEEWTRSRSPRELMERLQAAGVPAAEVVQQEGMREHPHYLARGFWESSTHPAAGTHTYPGPVAKLRETPLHIREPAPMLGQHNHEVLCGLLGVSEEHYRQLEADEIIGIAYREDAT